MPEQTRRLRIAVLASGGGRSLENLVQRSGDGSLPADVVCVVSNDVSAQVLQRAHRHGIPTAVIRPRDHADPAGFGAAVFATVEEYAADLVVLAGYLVRLPMEERYVGRVINIHPSLLPAFGGRGFYGHHVHEAVRAAGVKVSGCTVHFVDAEYDRGPILLQRTIPVSFEDSADEIAARVFAEEKIALPDAIRIIAEGRVLIDRGRVQVRRP